jgi:hypothetical protein
MGISLFGLTPAATYPSLIKFGDNSAISGTLRALSDGLGTDLPIQVSTAGVNFTGTASIGGTAIVTNASGVSGAIQFSDGSAFASDATNFFWDNTNKRLGVRTNAPSHSLEVRSTNQTDVIRFKSQFTQNGYLWTGNTQVGLGSSPFGDSTGNHIVLNNIGALIGAGGQGTATAKLQIVGSGSTSATTSLLVQNSAGTALMSVNDFGQVTLPTLIAGVVRSEYINTATNLFTVFQANTTNGNAKFYQSVSVGTSSDPVASAALEVVGTTKGFLPPRMTTIQRDAIVTPATGLRIYNTTTNTNDTYNGTAWQSNSVSGVSGAIQFSNGSAFASDAANFFWDDTNNRLGIGTNAPNQQLQVAGKIGTSVLQIDSQDTIDRGFGLRYNYTGGSHILRFFTNSGTERLTILNDGSTGISNDTPTARLHVKGSGSTSATTSLLVQNSAGSEALRINDDRSFAIGNVSYSSISTSISAGGINTYSAADSHLFNTFTSGYVTQLQVKGTQVSVGTTSPNASAKFQVDSTTSGFLPPRMTTTQRDAIVTPATGLRIYNTTTNTNDTYNGTAWQSNSVSGVAGAIQFSNGSAFASDASNFFWDDTNNRLGVGTNAPASNVHINNPAGGTIKLSLGAFDVIKSELALNYASGECRWHNYSGGYFATIYANNVEAMRIDGSQNVNIGATALGARLGIRGSGSTSATTSLLVQNSAGTEWFRIYDNGTTTFAGNITASANIECFSTIFVRGQLWGGTTNDLRLGTNGFGNAMAIASATGDVSISTSLTLNSTTKGFLPPRMTTTQKNAIASPAAGLMVYDTDLARPCFHNGATWITL